MRISRKVSIIVSAVTMGLIYTVLSFGEPIDLPNEEVLIYRTLDAEMRAIRAEAGLAIQERSQGQQTLKRTWERRYEMDATGCTVDMILKKLVCPEVKGSGKIENPTD